MVQGHAFEGLALLGTHGLPLACDHLVDLLFGEGHLCRTKSVLLLQPLHLGADLVEVDLEGLRLLVFDCAQLGGCTLDEGLELVSFLRIFMKSVEKRLNQFRDLYQAVHF